MNTASADFVPGAGRVMLRISHAGLQPIWLPLTKSHIVLGRAEDVDVPLDSHTVSRRHAELFRDPFERWWVRDLDSRNGTRLNGVKVGKSLVHPGDLLQIGDFQLSLSGEVTGPPGADTHATSSDARISVMQSVPDRIHRLHESQAPKIGHAHLMAVLEFGHALNVTPDAGERMARLCELVLANPFPGQSAVVVRADRRSPSQVQMLHQPLVDAEEQPAVNFSASVLRAICESPEPILATNLNWGGGDVALSIPVEVMEMSVAAVPLRFDERSVDLLYISLAPEAGHNDWLALISLAAKQYQQAEAVWRNMGTIKEYAAVERELQRAQQIQERLIPKTVLTPGLEAAVGFEPCTWVGGDYVDIVVMKDGRVLLVVADVCGKGLPAALVSSSLHTLVHASVRAGEDLPALIAAVNEYVCEYLGEQSYATLLCIAIDPATGDCECVCAGHPPGLIVSANGAVRQLNTARNLPLGLDRITFNISKDQLAPGEMLAIFTDGVTELRAENGEMLDVPGLSEGLGQLYTAAANQPLPEMVSHLNTCLDTFRGNGIVTDDRTFLLARLSGTR